VFCFGCQAVQQSFFYPLGTAEEHWPGTPVQIFPLLSEGYRDAPDFYFQNYHSYLIPLTVFSGRQTCESGLKKRVSEGGKFAEPAKKRPGKNQPHDNAVKIFGSAFFPGASNLYHKNQFQIL
jgi:hypothetical protein